MEQNIFMIIDVDEDNKYFYKKALAKIHDSVECL
jgi:hypothetical protein